jgi:hypothetical protein
MVRRWRPVAWFKGPRWGLAWLDGGSGYAATQKGGRGPAGMQAHQNEISTVARLWCNSAPMMGRWRQWVHELHHNGGLLMGLRMEEDWR